MQKVLSLSFLKNNNIKFETHKHKPFWTNLNKTVLIQNDNFEKETNKLVIAGLEVGVSSPITGLVLRARNSKLGQKCHNFIKKTIFKSTNNVQNKRIIPRMPKVLTREEKRLILERTGINSYIQQCNVKGYEIDPKTILNMLNNIEGVKIKEIDFIIRRANSPIQNGRAFSVKISNSLDMTFEVHDYKNKNGSISWIMRLYDNDKKNARSYLSKSGAFKHGGDSYFSQFTHINCGDKGREFVLK